MIRIGILGYAGRMGQLIAEEIATSSTCVLAGGVVRALSPDMKKPGNALITTHADEVIAASDVVIDVTLADASPGYAQRAVAKGKPFVCCTTGFDAAGLESLKQASSAIPLLYAPNTSLSLAAIKRLTALAAKLLAGFDYDAAILDEHHRLKKDAPSGAAKALGEAVIAGSDGNMTPGYASVRAGHIVGEHEVILSAPGETIRIRASVAERRTFARGALQAALWLRNKPQGFYGMDDVLGI